MKHTTENLFSKFRFAVIGCVPLFLFLFSVQTFSQNIAAPDLNCVNTLPNGDVVLTWTLPTAPPPPCVFVSYDIYASQNSATGPFIFMQSVTTQAQTQWTDIGASGTVNTIYYYIVCNYTGCAGAPTFLHSDTINNRGPVDSTIAYVSVTGSSSTLIVWNPSPSPQTFGYVLYHVVGGFNIPFDTVYGTTFYIDNNFHSDSASQTFTVAAIDSCGNIGAIYNPPHHTIYLTATVNHCAGTITLNWNTYANWVGGVLHYEVWVDSNFNGAVKIDSLTGTTYTFSNFTNGDVLDFHIAAISNNGNYISLSNTVEIIPHVIHPANNLFIRNVTVASADNVNIYYSVDPQADIFGLDLERSDDNVTFTKINSMVVPASFNGVNMVADNTAQTDFKSYYYRITATDSCGNKQLSTVAKTILLEGYSFTNQKNALEWNDYFLEHGTNLGYNIYRNPTVASTLITFSPAGINTFEEVVTNVVDQSGKLCYVVEALDTTNFPNGIHDTVWSRSNELCLDQLIKLWMPNAFSPDGTNNIYKPVTLFTANKTYLFEIYNRWGGKIFETTKFDKGWDGTYNSKDCEMGVYCYHVLVVDAEGRKTEKQGTVLLLR